MKPDIYFNKVAKILNYFLIGIKLNIFIKSIALTSFLTSKKCNSVCNVVEKSWIKTKRIEYEMLTNKNSVARANLSQYVCIHQIEEGSELKAHNRNQRKHVYTHCQAAK